MPAWDSTSAQSTCDNFSVLEIGRPMPRNSRKAHGASLPPNSMETGVSAETIIYCSGLPSSAAIVLDAALSSLSLGSASMGLLVVIFRYGMVRSCSSFRWLRRSCGRAGFSRVLPIIQLQAHRKVPGAAAGAAGAARRSIRSPRRRTRRDWSPRTCRGGWGGRHRRPRPTPGIPGRESVPTPGTWMSWATPARRPRTRFPRRAGGRTRGGRRFVRRSGPRGDGGRGSTR